MFSPKLSIPLVKLIANDSDSDVDAASIELDKSITSNSNCVMFPLASVEKRNESLFETVFAEVKVSTPSLKVKDGVRAASFKLAASGEVKVTDPVIESLVVKGSLTSVKVGPV